MRIYNDEQRAIGTLSIINAGNSCVHKLIIRKKDIPLYHKKFNDFLNEANLKVVKPQYSFRRHHNYKKIVDSFYEFDTYYLKRNSSLGINEFIKIAKVSKKELKK